MSNGMPAVAARNRAILDQHLQLRRDVACVALPVSLLGRARYCGYFGILSRMAVLSAILS